MMPAHDVARYFVSLVDEEAGDSITNLKLQKLLYYAQGVNLALNDVCLFPDPIEAWTHGPVVPNVYRAYKQHGGEAIPVEQVNLEAYEKDTCELLDEVVRGAGLDDFAVVHNKDTIAERSSLVHVMRREYGRYALLVESADFIPY